MEKKHTKNNFKGLTDLLKLEKDKILKIVTFQGNIGDYFIYEALIKMLSDLNLKYEIKNSTDKFNENDKLFILSNGNFNSYYEDTTNFLKNNFNKNIEFIFLPCTIYNVDNILTTLKNENFKIFSREKYTFEYLKNFNIKSELCPDLVFYLSKDYLNEFFGFKEIDNNKIGYFLREDFEKSDKKLNDSNIDISGLYSFESIKDFKSDKFKNSLLKFINELNLVDTVNTNRTHVSIISFLLNKKINFFESSYYKNNGIYDYMMKYSENVKFISNINIKVVSKYRNENNYLENTINKIKEKCEIFTSDFKEDTPYKDQINNNKINFYTQKEGFENHIKVLKSTPVNYAYNFQRALNSMKKEEDNSYLILLEDDLEFTENWLIKAQLIINEIEKKHENYILSLYSPFEDICNLKENISFNKYNNEKDYTKFYGSQATIWNKESALDFAKFNETINLNDYNIENDKIDYQIDHLISLYANYKGIPIFTTVPSLIQHIGFKTSGLAQFMHQSPSFKEK